MKKRTCPNAPNPCFCTGVCMRPEPPKINYVGDYRCPGCGYHPCACTEPS